MPNGTDKTNSSQRRTRKSKSFKLNTNMKCPFISRTIKRKTESSDKKIASSMTIVNGLVIICQPSLNCCEVP